MNLNGKKCVVIGGAGLIGSHTVDKLLRYDIKELVIFDNFVRGTNQNLENALKDPRVKIFEAGGDIRNTDILSSALNGADCVFHFAALWLLQCYDYPRAAFDVNITGTFNVLEACRDNGIKKIVFSSSASVYGDAIEEPMSESHPFNNRTFYGATKIAGEAMCTAFYERYKVPYVGLRYMNVYGPRQDYRGAYIAVIMKMLDSIDRGEALKVFGDGSQAYDFISVYDCAEANICAMESNIEDRFYNVGTGLRTSIKELANLVNKLSGSNRGIEYMAEGQTFVKNRIADIKNAQNDINFVAKVSLDQGLKDLIEWRDSHKLEVEQRRAAAGID